MFADRTRWQKKYPNTGESVYLSYSNLKACAVPTIVPPHYSFDQDFWGSIPQVSSIFSGGTQARSNVNTNREKTGSFIKEINALGWIHLHEAYKEYCCDYIDNNVIRK